jgi:hypothetical protein
MNLDNLDISKLPSDVRKTFLRLKVLHAEKKIRRFFIFCKSCMA